MGASKFQNHFNKITNVGVTVTLYFCRLSLLTPRVESSLAESWFTRTRTHVVLLTSATFPFVSQPVFYSTFHFLTLLFAVHDHVSNADSAHIPIPDITQSSSADFNCNVSRKVRKRKVVRWRWRSIYPQRRGMNVFSCSQLHLFPWSFNPTFERIKRPMLFGQCWLEELSNSNCNRF